MYVCHDHRQQQHHQYSFAEPVKLHSTDIQPGCYTTKHMKVFDYYTLLVMCTRKMYVVQIVISTMRVTLSMFHPNNMYIVA